MRRLINIYAPCGSSANGRCKFKTWVACLFARAQVTALSSLLHSENLRIIQLGTQSAWWQYPSFPCTSSCSGTVPSLMVYRQWVSHQGLWMLLMGVRTAVLWDESQHSAAWILWHFISESFPSLISGTNQRSHFLKHFNNVYVDRISHKSIFFFFFRYLWNFSQNDVLYHHSKCSSEVFLF